MANLRQCGAHVADAPARGTADFDGRRQPSACDITPGARPATPAQHANRVGIDQGLIGQEMERFKTRSTRSLIFLARSSRLLSPPSLGATVELGVNMTQLSPHKKLRFRLGFE
jgi:hypothetical protein